MMYLRICTVFSILLSSFLWAETDGNFTDSQGHRYEKTLEKTGTGILPEEDLQPPPTPYFDSIIIPKTGSPSTTINLGQPSNKSDPDKGYITTAYDYGASTYETGKNAVTGTGRNIVWLVRMGAEKLGLMKTEKTSGED